MNPFVMRVCGTNQINALYYYGIDSITYINIKMHQLFEPFFPFEDLFILRFIFFMALNWLIFYGFENYW